MRYSFSPGLDPVPGVSAEGRNEEWRGQRIWDIKEKITDKLDQNKNTNYNMGLNMKISSPYPTCVGTPRYNSWPREFPSIGLFKSSHCFGSFPET